MGSQTIPLRANAQVIDEQWFNIFRQAFSLDQVPRNASAVATDQGGSLGTSSVRFLNAYLMNLLLMDGTKFIKQKAPAGLAADYTLTLPPGLPASGKKYVPQVTDSGIMTFEAITKDQLSPTIDLPSQATINSRNVVGSGGGENLTIVRGFCNGTASGSSSGFSWTSSGTGVYIITFNTSFLSTPTVVATVDNQVVGDDYVCSIGAVLPSSATIVTVFGPNTVRTSIGFHVIAMGVRTVV